MQIDLADLGPEQLEAAALHYEEQGYLLLGGVEEAVTTPLRLVVEQALGSGLPEGPLEPQARRKLGRVPTPPPLAAALLGALGPLLERLIGPLVHVSSTFHTQVKMPGAAPAVDHGGYQDDYLEVHGRYLLHQDFAGASIPTSPSAVTLWAGLNSCSDWRLRLCPGSHRRGLLCHRWLELDDPRLPLLGDPVDIAARPGEAVLFHALMLHGTASPGPGRRLSCDIRFFPLCGFLPSQVHALGERPYAALSAGLARAGGPVLRAPLLETQAWLGDRLAPVEAPPHSVLNWANYAACRFRGAGEEARQHLERMVNTSFSADPASVYTAKFHGRAVEQETLAAARQRIAAELAAPELSLVVPCYNEEACLETTVPALAEAFARAGVALELVLVNNGSTDRTAEIIDRLAARGLPVVKGSVAVNQGQGLGIRAGLDLARGRVVGWISADGQVTPEAVVELYRLLRNQQVPALAKARRRNRHDGWVRRGVSFLYNALIGALFFPMPSFDINCNPKMMPAEVARRMQLESSDWFLEAETMLKARPLGLEVIELEVLDRPRQGGASHVRSGTVLEFLKNLAAWRLRRRRRWHRHSSLSRHERSPQT